MNVDAPMTEEGLGRAWAAKAYKEGHRGKYPGMPRAKRSHVAWTRDQVVTLRRLRLQGVPVEQIADEMDRTVDSIASKISALGNNGAPYEETRQALKADEWQTTTAIGNAMGVTVDTASKRLARLVDSGTAERERRAGRSFWRLVK